MRIDGFNGIPSSNVYQDAGRTHISESEVPKPAKVDGICDTVEISSRRQKECVDTQEGKQLSLLFWLKQHWSQTRGKVVALLVKTHILKIDDIDPKRIQFNPYFVAEIKRDLQSWVLFQKVKYRVQAITQSLVKWFSEFTGGNYFAKKEESKEELPKKERYSKTAVKKEEATKEESVEYHIDRKV